MAQNFTDDVFDPNHDGQTDLQNIENNFAALKSQFGGLAAPANTVAGQPWVDLTSHILKIRNEANTDWLSIFNMATGQPVGVSTNADTVDNIHAATTATANKLLALNASAVMPCSITGNAAGLTTTLAVASGGTGSTTAAAAADNLSVVKRDHNYSNVGSFCFCLLGGGLDVAAGGTTSGANLYPYGFGIDASGQDQAITSLTSLHSIALTGTWRCLGYATYTNNYAITLWQRIS
ncbi:MAG: hypothetical protein WCZ86_05880 [Desulfurivibrionaceae bacterium]